mmetsp:Transcript_97246/g.167587  ORF Transcript_97246/g.167587 Transcript_97246/m.167587 type:complete len:281 (-) Transcript_97246:214-1056(-)
MPPKKGGAKKAEQERQRLEREAADRQASEDDESRERDNLELAQRLEHDQLMLAFRETQVSLMVDLKAYRDLQQQLEDTTKAHAQQMQELEDELALTQKTKATLEEEMNDIRLDQKLLAKSVPRQMKALEEAMFQSVGKVITSMDADKQADADSKAVMRNFNLEFGHHKQVYLDMLHETQGRLRQLSQVYAESKSMHSNLPKRIKLLLHDKSKEELMFMIDTLSFEESVLQYFEHKFPRSQPQRKATTPTPMDLGYGSASSKLLDVEMEAAAEAAARSPSP